MFLWLVFCFTYKPFPILAFRPWGFCLGLQPWFEMALVSFIYGVLFPEVFGHVLSFLLLLLMFFSFLTLLFGLLGMVFSFSRLLKQILEKKKHIVLISQHAQQVVSVACE